MFRWISLPVPVVALIGVVTLTGSGSATTAKQENDDTVPLKVFLLAGQSNMVGMGSIDHLDSIVNGDHDPVFDVLWDTERQTYKKRDDVFIKFNDAHGHLSVSRSNCFAGSNAFGPEVMFGWTIGDALASCWSKNTTESTSSSTTTKTQVALLIKTAWGGKTLAVDFRPPSAGEGNYGDHPVHYGWLYRTMVEDILDTLNNLDRYNLPNYSGYELAGFLWFQGWNDMLNWDTVNEYGPNLIKFIRDIRLDLDAPNLPFVIGELGMHGLTPEGRGSDRVLALRAAQHSVTLLDEFIDTTLFVRTAPYAVLNGTTNYNGIYHYNGRADTYFYMGQAMGRGMLQLLGCGSGNDSGSSSTGSRSSTRSSSGTHETFRERNPNTSLDDISPIYSSIV